MVNLKYFSKFLCRQKFKYEDLRIVMLLVEKGEYMFTFDLKSGYHDLDVSPTQCNYMGFSWEREGKKEYYIFICSIAFRLAIACNVFTKVLRPLVKFWRSSKRAGGI